MTDESAHHQPEFTTRICREDPTSSNPFVAQQRYIAGYEQRSLWQQCDYLDGVFLHLSGDLPAAEQKLLMQTLMLGLMNLGPRDPAIRSAMVAGISKTRVEHLLPIGLMACEGSIDGAAAVMESYRFIKSKRYASVQNWVNECVAGGQWGEHLSAPGFGQLYGSVDPILQSLAQDLYLIQPQSKTFIWCQQLITELQAFDMGWLASGITAAVGVELQLGARQTMALYQISRSLGIVSHGVEQTQYRMHNAPILDDEHYDYEDPLATLAEPPSSD